MQRVSLIAHKPTAKVDSVCGSFYTRRRRRDYQSSSSNFGAQVLVTAHADWDRMSKSVVVSKGEAMLSDIEVEHAGGGYMPTSGAFRGALEFERLGNTPSYLRRVVVHSSYGGIGLYETRDMVVADSATYRLSMDGCLIGGGDCGAFVAVPKGKPKSPYNRHRNTIGKLYRNLAVRSTGKGVGFHIVGANVVVGNVAAGSSHCGFLMAGGPCSPNPGHRIQDVVSHSNPSGVVALNKLSPFDSRCMEYRNVNVHHNSKVGLQALARGSIRVTGLRAVHNQVGIALVPNGPDFARHNFRPELHWKVEDVLISSSAIGLVLGFFASGSTTDCCGSLRMQSLCDPGKIVNCVPDHRGAATLHGECAVVCFLELIPAQ